MTLNSSSHFFYYAMMVKPHSPQATRRVAYLWPYCIKMPSNFAAYPEQSYDTHLALVSFWQMNRVAYWGGRINFIIPA